MTFLRNDYKRDAKFKRQKRKIAWSAAVFLTLVFLMIKTGPAAEVSFVANSVFLKPISRVRFTARSWSLKLSAYLTSRDKLTSANESLASENTALKTKILDYEAIKKQNEDILTLVSRKDKPGDYIAAPVLLSPPQSPYDILIIDGGSKQGIREGMKAIALDSVLIGYVEETSPDTSKIKMLSYPGVETRIIFTDSDVAATAVGSGGGNFTVRLPSSVEIHSEDVAGIPGIRHFTMGTVLKVEINLTDPFQTIFLRFPFNIQHLEWVMLEK